MITEYSSDIVLIFIAGCVLWGVIRLGEILDTIKKFRS